MNAITQLLVAGTATLLTAAASAGMTTGEPMQAYTNGGTGFIGVTQSAGQPRMARPTGMGMAAGEATTMIDGRPNENPDAPKRTAMAPRDAQLRVMGNIASGVARNPSWGTPD